MPFIDSESYMKYIENNGIPVIQDSSIIFPRDFNNQPLLIEINHFNSQGNQDHQTTSTMRCNVNLSPKFYTKVDVMISLGYPAEDIPAKKRIRKSLEEMRRYY